MEVQFSYIFMETQARGIINNAFVLQLQIQRVEVPHFGENTHFLALCLFFYESNRAAPHRVGVAKVSDHKYKHINLLKGLCGHSDDK